MNRLKKLVTRALREFKSSVIESWYVFCRGHLPLKNKGILLQSRYGDDFGGNIFYLLKELSNNYPGYTLYLAYIPKTKSKYTALLKHYHINNVHLIRLHRFTYWRLLGTCKYLINDVTFHACFIKRRGQQYLNTWHGTPLKKMGLDEAKTAYNFGNMQRNFFASDYLLCPSGYMTELMVKAYSLDHLFEGKILNEGYPRNAVFFDKARALEVRHALGLSEKQIIVYMPTWRGNSNTDKSETYTAQLQSYLDELDAKLNDNQFFFVKLHPLATAEVSIDQYKHIRHMPEEYETYDFLNAADCLVTDYSSVMFDFACSGKNIILFTYDENEYLQDRGLYISIVTLPFVQAKTVDQLISAINTRPHYLEDNFIRGIVEHENSQSVKRVCAQFLGYDYDCKTVQLPSNGKTNVFIYLELIKNGITSAAFDLLHTIDLEKRNYFAVYKLSPATYENREKLNDLPSHMGLLSIDTLEKTVMELFALFFYYKFNWSFSIINHFVAKSYQRMFMKYYGNIPHDIFIQFVGYGRDPLNLFLQAPKKFVFVHNDMKKELSEKKVQHKNTLLTCYRKYDKVVGVSSASTNIAAEIAGHAHDFRTVHNCFDYRGTTSRGNMDVELDVTTDCQTMNADGINGILRSSGNKFISIGRFSPEKEHLRLLDAFNMYWADHQDSQLIIIGGYGDSYRHTLNYARKLPCTRNVCLIKSINNPISILKRCNLFVLSSSHEGLPVVFFEADCLGVPILSTNIDGPREILTQYQGGLLVEESAEALYRGMLEFDAGNIMPLNINMQEYNQRCIDEFEALFE
ncbi:glycosyltransferase [Pyramidobacter sp. SM-530-WT-4B]|uniref:Glycosyltransferase n=1 Tax=Pyramidobacter porci TaxID=2605789 RepID=A0A6L5YDL7_9BACT|nr:CDP-glycerol glycerophosphotransferase family protein [Pyramidobacter porci]MST56361.1 glycosyltransferase [Pyramidobacter porci]